MLVIPVAPAHHSRALRFGGMSGMYTKNEVGKVGFSPPARNGLVCDWVFFIL